MKAASAAHRVNGGEYRPDRAVIDIGSNTVRLVVYTGSRRAPAVFLNEKVTARLGRDLMGSGRMPDKAMDLALSGLARFALILKDLDVTDVQCVATAAVRDASNGAQFLERVRALGLDPRLLSGEEEARYAALGVIGAFPKAQGLVADLGGGSLELVELANGECGQGVSLPLGTLRLAPLRAKGDEPFRKAVTAALDGVRWARDVPGPLYLVGGTWRALATLAMIRTRYPLSDPHAYTLDLPSPFWIDMGLFAPLGAQLGDVFVQRFDVQAMPAQVVKRLGDGIVRRVIGADVDIKTVLDVLERTHQHHVFAILRVRDKTHGVISICESSHSEPANTGLSALMTRRSRSSPRRAGSQRSGRLPYSSR